MISLTTAFDARVAAVGLIVTLLPIAIQVKNGYAQMLSRFRYVRNPPPRSFLSAGFCSSRIATGVLCVVIPEVMSGERERMVFMISVALNSVISTAWPWIYSIKYPVVNGLAVLEFLASIIMWFMLVLLIERPMIDRVLMASTLVLWFVTFMWSLLGSMSLIMCHYDLRYGASKQNDDAARYPCYVEDLDEELKQIKVVRFKNDSSASEGCQGDHPVVCDRV